MRHLLLIASLFLFSPLANAQGVANFYYQKGSLSFQRMNPPPLPNMPWQPENTPVQPDTSLLSVAVDIRPVSSLQRQEGWFNMGNLQGLNGMMFVADSPETIRISAMEYYQPLDILWFDNNGVVIQVAPNLLLAGNREGISADKPSKAVLMLAAGTAQLYAINPGDKVIGSEYFAVPPKVLTLPQ